MLDTETGQLLAELAELNRRIFTLISLIAFQVADGKTLAEAAPILKRLGLSQSEIADVVGSTSKAVSVRLAEAKRGMKKKARTHRK